MVDRIDPINSLIEYVNEIKPFHSKIIETLTEYVYSENINVTMTDLAKFDIGVVVEGVDIIDINSNLNSNEIGGSYGVGPYDSSPSHPVIAVNITLTQGAFDPIAPGFDVDNNTVAIPADQTALYRPGRNVEVILSKFNTTTGLTTEITSLIFTILSSTFEENQQTNGIINTPLTRLVLSGLNATTEVLNDDEQFVATVNLEPSTFNSVVIGYGSAARVFYTQISPTPTPQASQMQIADEDFLNGTYANSIIFDGDVVISYPFNSKLTITLASGERNTFNVVNSFYDSTNDKTVVRLLEDLDGGVDYVGAEIIELFTGYDDIFIRSVGQRQSQDTTEGLARTRVLENINFGWVDSDGEVLIGKQYVIKEIRDQNTILINGDASDIISNGDQVKIIKSEDVSNDGTYQVTDIISTGIETIVEVSGSLTNSTGSIHRGWLETT